MHELRQDFSEIGAPAIADDKMGTVQLQAGDKRRIDLEDYLWMRAKCLADQLPVACLIGGLDGRRADRFEFDTISHHE